MKNQHLYRRFIAASTTAVLAFGSMAPVTAAYAEEQTSTVTATEGKSNSEILGAFMAGLLASLPSAEDVSQAASGVIDGAKGAYDAVYNAELNLNVDLDKLAEAVGLPKSSLPLGLKSFNDIKDFSKIFDALGNADLNDFVDMESVIKQLGLDTAKLPEDLLDANSLKSPEDLMGIWEDLDLNALVDLEQLVDQAGLGTYDLPEELFDANSVKDPAKLQAIFDEMDFDQFLDLNALLETDLGKGVLSYLGMDELPEGVDELNDLKDLDNVAALFDAIDMAEVSKNTQISINGHEVTLADLGFDSLDDYLSLEGYREAYGPLDEAMIQPLIADTIDALNKLLSENSTITINGTEFDLAELGFDSVDDFLDLENYKKAAAELGQKLDPLMAKIMESVSDTLSTSQWIQLPDGSWMYWNADKHFLSTGWEMVNGKWYLFNGFGIMQTGWQCVDDVWYYLGKSGAMKTGWQQIGNIWYYMDASGAMLTGWQFINGHWFYLGPKNDGAMRTGTFTDDTGNTWTCDANGYWIA